MNKDNNIERIIDYLDQQMDETSKEQFEAQLQDSAPLSVEYEKYQELIGGLSFLGLNTFEQQLQSWETEWQSAKTDDVELIDWYLKGQLGEKGASLVDKRLETDQAFAQSFQKQKKISSGFELMRSQQFVNQIAEKEESSNKEDRSTENHLTIASKNVKQKNVFLLRRIAASVLVLLALSSLLYIYVYQNFNNTSISLDLYESPINEDFMGETEDENKRALATQMEQADLLFNNGKYDESFLAYNRIFETIPQLQLDDFNRQYYTEEAEWYRLLAAQAMSTSPLDLQKEASRIADTQGHGHQEEAAMLHKKLRSFWYELIN